MRLFSGSREATPLDGTDAVLADLDGVVYAGHRALPHAVESLVRAAEGRRLGYITNNASRTDETVAAQLRELGLPAQKDDVITSPQAAMRLLRDFRRQLKEGVERPVLDPANYTDLDIDREAWKLPQV